MTETREIRECIESLLDAGYRKLIIYPYGDIGIKVKYILNTVYGRQEAYIIDNYLSIYNTEIKASSIFPYIDCRRLGIIVATKEIQSFKLIHTEISQYFKREQVGILPSMQGVVDSNTPTVEERENIFAHVSKTRVGRHSYGPLAVNHRFIESVGAFCSFAAGCDVLENHPLQYISTHPFVYLDYDNNELFPEYERLRGTNAFVEGIHPRGKTAKLSRITIGNDVWLGRNVLITNGSNIGNGVVAGAGAVITRDVPDYAIVAGVPAHIIRYRYEPQQIEALNRIAWWDWDDDLIRERYDDFFIPAEAFIEKYIDS